MDVANDSQRRCIAREQRATTRTRTKKHNKIREGEREPITEKAKTNAFYRPRAKRANAESQENEKPIDQTSCVFANKNKYTSFHHKTKQYQHELSAVDLRQKIPDFCSFRAKHISGKYCTDTELS